MGLPVVAIATELAKEAVNILKQPEIVRFLEKNKHMILAGIKVAVPEIKRQNDIKRSEKRAKYHVRGWHIKDDDYHMLTKTYVLANGKSIAGMVDFLSLYLMEKTTYKVEAEKKVENYYCVDITSPFDSTILSIIGLNYLPEICITIELRLEYNMVHVTYHNKVNSIIAYLKYLAIDPAEKGIMKILESQKVEKIPFLVADALDDYCYGPLYRINLQNALKGDTQLSRCFCKEDTNNDHFTQSLYIVFLDQPRLQILSPPACERPHA